jgi:hypothetical protein
MSRGRKEQAVEMARKMRGEATLWEAGLTRSLHDMRSWSVLYAARRYQLAQGIRRRSRSVAQLKLAFDEAHDLLLSAKENVDHMWRAIRASHLSASVYEEAVDDREWAEARDGDYGDYRD